MAETNWIKEYYSQIESGEIVVSEKVRKVYKHLTERCDVHDEWHYDQSRAQHAIDFIERFCRHSKGKQGGQRIILELWEKAFVWSIFGFIDDDGLRQYHQAMLIVGRKNGKSLLASAIGLYMMVADGEAGADVYSVAMTRDQAKVVWSEAKKMVRKSPTLLKKIRTTIGEMTADFNDSTFKPLASDSDSLDGLNVHCALMDELHAWRRGSELYNVIADGTSARDEPLILITTTAGTVREDIYDAKYEEAERIINGYEDPDGYKDDRTLPIIYELDKRAEWTEEEMWYKANPGLGTIKNLDTLRRKVERAKEDPKQVKNLCCKEFNIRETTGEAWLTFEELYNAATHDINELRPRYGIGGIDLSSTTDLTAAKIIYMIRDDPTQQIYVESMYWIPEDLLDEKVQQDSIPYDLWRDRGLLRTCPGNKINPRVVTDWFIEMRDEKDIWIPYIGYDSWSSTYWVDEMRATFGKESMIPVVQGYKTFTIPMRTLGADLAAKKINYNCNPVDTWNFANVSYEEDKNANIRPIKTSRSTRRIDGFMALLDAYVVLQDRRQEYEGII